MRPFDEETPPTTISREQASAAGLLAAILFFVLAVCLFIAVNAYWPAAQMIVKPSTNIHGSAAPNR
jgi:hypothetical protein